MHEKTQILIEKSISNGEEPWTRGSVPPLNDYLFPNNVF